MSKRKWKKPLHIALSAGLVASFAIPVVPITAEAATNAADLIISEYVEGSSYNKAIELYNGTGQEIDLSNYTIEHYSNSGSTGNAGEGKTTPSSTLQLSGKLASGKTYVVTREDANEAIVKAAQTSGLLDDKKTVINFNGNDQIVLKKGNEIIDSIGQVGSAEGKASDVSLVRNPNITTGDKVIDDNFDWSLQWTNLGKDNFSNIGSHTMGGTIENPEEPETPIEVISIADARTQGTGAVSVKGTVTAKLKNTIQIQDGTAAIAVRPASLNVQLGDEITVTGTLAEYKGLLQLNNATLSGEVKSGEALTPKVLTGAEVGEEHESKLVTVNNVAISGEGQNWTATADGATFTVRDENNNLGFITGTTYDSITGIVQEFDGTYQIIPRSTSDIVGDLEKPEVPTEVSTVAEARKAGAGATVTIEGIATTNTGLWGYETFYMQDDTAGMFVFGSPQNVKPGDKVKITGKLLTYKNELEIDPSSLEIISSGNPLPAAQVVAPSAVKEDTQGELIKLENITITDLQSDSYGTAIFQAKTENGEQVRVIHDNRTGSDYNELIKHYNEGDKVHLKGIVSIDNDGYHVKTFGLESYDLVNKPAVYVTQAQGTVPADTKIELQSGIEGAQIYYTTDGSEPTTASAKYVGPIALKTGETTIKAIAVNGENTSEVFSFTYTILNTEGVTIRDIQGKGHVSKYDGSSVKGITGVVTHVISGSTFIIQDINADDDKTTSEAIQVSKSSHGVSVGDKVTVDGIVEETGGGANLSKTQLNASTVTKAGTAELPAPLVVGKDIMPPNKIIDNDQMTSFDPTEDGIDFWESVEFMRVSFPNAKVVGPPYSGDVPIIVESTTNNELNSQGGLNIAADDYNPEKIFLDNVGSNFKSGDSFDGDVVGVISYSSSGYQLLTNKDTLPKVIESNIQPEVTHITPVEDKLTVASYNIENFSNNKANTPDEKVARIAKSFVDNMKSPDIITLVEVQDNDGETNSGNTDASESYTRLINAIKAAGGPTYEWTDVAPVNNTNGGAPGGNIRVGYLYNPERVTLAEGKEGTGTQANSWSETGNLTLNPGVIDPSKFSDTRKPIAAEFEFQGERVVVIGAHLNSKGGDQSLWGSNQPPKLNSEAERLGLAQTVNEFIDEGLAKNPDVNIVLAGDMNDFEFTKTLETLKGDVLTNMVDIVPANDRFSYFFQGNNQVLDHILVSNHLVTSTVADMIHINANFTAAQGQASDHDPVLVQIDLADEEDSTPITAEKVYNFTNFKTGKLVINKPSVSVTINGNSEIKNGVVFQGEYAEFHGDGFKNTTITLEPKKAGAIVDFKGIAVGEVIISGTNVKEIRGADNVTSIKYENGASAENITFK